MPATTASAAGDERRSQPVAGATSFLHTGGRGTRRVFVVEPTAGDEKLRQLLAEGHETPSLDYKSTVDLSVQIASQGVV